MSAKVPVGAPVGAPAGAPVGAAAAGRADPARSPGAPPRRGPRRRLWFGLLTLCGLAKRTLPGVATYALGAPAEIDAFIAELAG